MNTGGLLGGRGVAENTYQVQTTPVFLSRNVLANGRVRKAETIFTYMTHSQMVEGRYSKWFQSAKKGVLNLFLSIYMAYNVISCQKVAENTQILKIAKFAM